MPDSENSPFLLWETYSPKTGTSTIVPLSVPNTRHSKQGRQLGNITDTVFTNVTLQTTKTLN